MEADNGLPDVFRAVFREHWDRFVDANPDKVTDLSANPKVFGSLARVWTCSEFVRNGLLRYPADLGFLLGEAGLQSAWSASTLAGQLASALTPETGDTEGMQALRVFRRRQMIRIAWRDLAGWASLDETLGHLSELADVCISAAVDIARRQLEEAHGQPLDTEGRPVGLIVLAMGKLGGRELNYSSDVDLVFLFENGDTTPGPRQISREQFFIRLGQRVIRLLDEVTEDGFVFRVDMRLRPFGDSGPLAVSTAALEDYLQRHGRAWERYAYVKARPVTGHRPGMGLYSELLRPFVYRRYLDYGVYESLREIKRLIETESAEGDLRDDIKRGPGGIREIEFIVQSLQILRGGSIKELRSASLMRVLPRLRGGRLLADTVVDDLLAAYTFMRRLENRLQQWQDRQTHRLPASDEGRVRLAYSLGYRDWHSCSADIDLHRGRVREHFLAQLEGSQGAPVSEVSDRVAGLWSGAVARDNSEQVLGSCGYTDVDRTVAALDHLRSAGFARRLDESGRQRLDALVPALIRESGQHRNPEVTLERLAGILESVGRRSAYFALLNENPGVLKHLTRLCSRSEFLARQIATHPLLLDELIDPRVFERLPVRETLGADLRRRLSTVGPDDLESQLEVLKQFQRSAVFLVAVADLSSKLPLMKVSDRLTEIAETVLDSCLRLASQQMHARYGRPQCGRGSGRRESGFAIVGYGKLGGLELGYSSDLDLVFIHDSEGDEQVTEGPTSLDNGLFYGRLTRRLVHLLTTQTSSGLLYEVDTRLRPSGKGGLLVTSLDAFDRYQRSEAWTWEHQALLRARAVAGTPAVRAGFETMRRDLLCTAVRKDTLRQEVAEMREKMRAELGSREPARFDIKQDRGGIADIEFLVQYLVLLNASEHPVLVTYPDNVRQLESLVEEGIMAPDLAAELKAAYLDYRARIHRLALEDQPARVSDAEFADQRERVAAVWESEFGS